MTQQITAPRVFVFFLIALLTLACGENSGNGGTDADALDGELGDDVQQECTLANDGICDEPSFCAPGTDAADCEAACAERPDDPFLGAACAFRQETSPPPIPTELGTGGNSHVTGHIDGTFQIPDGNDPGRLVDRHYRLFVPETYDPAIPTPLVLVLPGNRVALYTQASYTQIPALAETNRFIVAYLQQQFRNDTLAESWWTDWDWANNADNNPDFAFIRAVVDQVAEGYNLDPGRVFAAGHSRGAAMSVIAALEMPDLIAGAVSHSGFVELGYDQRIPLLDGPETPLYFFHGAADDDVCIDCVPGGECGVTPGRSCFSVLATDELVTLLREQGWTDDELVYERLEGVAHRWQPQLNQAWWDFLSTRPNPGQPEWSSTDRRLAIWSHQPVFPVEPATSPSSARGPVAPQLDTDSMIQIPAGTFPMGYSDEPIGRYGDAWFVDQQPEHSVTLSAFSIDQSEVTVARFARFLTWAGGEKHFHPAQPIERVESGYLPVAGAEDEPIRQVTWTAARDFCTWAGKRLPTEAEWERAAAGAEDRHYPWPDSGAECSRAAYFTGSSTCVSSPVTIGSYPTGATPSGVLDLAGNVGEWTADWYAPYPGVPVDNPTGPDDGIYKVVRGGSYHEPGPALRTHARRPVVAESRGDTIGFRCAWDQAVQTNPEIGRGELPEISDRNRMPSPRPFAPAAPVPDILHSGLQTPTLLERTADDSIWVVEAGAGQLTRISPDGERSVVLEDLVEPRFLISDGQSLALGDTGDPDAATGTIWRIDAGASPTLVASDLASLAGLSFHNTELVYINNDSLFLSQSETAPIATGLDDAQVMLAVDGIAYLFEGGAPAVRRLIAVSIEDGSISELADSGALSGLTPVDLQLSEDTLQVGLRQSGFPNSSLLCEADLTTGGFACIDYTPPRLESIANAPDGTVYFRTRRVVGVDEPNGSYRVLSQWSKPGDVLVSGDAILWTDQHAGRILSSSR